MSTAITTYVSATLDEKRAYVQTLASAGELLPKGLWANVRNADGIMENRPSPGKIMLIVETGIMLGLHPMAALQGIDVIEGNPTLKPALMSALIRQAGHSLRIEPSGSVGGGDIACTTTIIRSDDPDFPYVYRWTMDDALAAGLIDSYLPDPITGIYKVKARSKDGKVLPWEAYTKRLLRWRSLSDAASAAAEDVLLGMHYLPEELGALTNESGEIIDEAELVPTEDWATLVKDATTKEQLLDIGRRATAAGEYTDPLRTAVLTAVGKLSRAADVIEDEARSAAPLEQDAPTLAPVADRDPAEPTDAEYAELEAEASE
jgi:hypothetical protein